MKPESLVGVTRLEDQGLKHLKAALFNLLKSVNIRIYCKNGWLSLSQSLHDFYYNFISLCIKVILKG